MKYVDYKPGKSMKAYKAFDYSYAILELCNITSNALFALDMDTKFITNVIYDILGILDYRNYFGLEQSWYELD